MTPGYNYNDSLVNPPRKVGKPDMMMGPVRVPSRARTAADGEHPRGHSRSEPLPHPFRSCHATSLTGLKVIWCAPDFAVA